MNHLNYKKAITKKWVIYSIITVIASILLIVLLFVVNSSPIFCCADGFANAKVFTWLDLNANGQVDQGEPPLENVAAMLIRFEQYPLKQVFEDIHSKTYFEGEGITDIKGTTNLFIFMPGCTRHCWDGYSVAVEVPSGYKPTTPIMYVLENNDLKFDFGFEKAP
jgi:hypothetical protein